VAKHFDIVESTKMLEVPTDTYLWKIPNEATLHHDLTYGVTSLTFGTVIEETAAEWERDFWDDDVPDSFLALTPRGAWLAIGMIQIRDKQRLTACFIPMKEARSMLSALDTSWSDEPSQAEKIAEGIFYVLGKSRLYFGNNLDQFKCGQWEQAATWLAGCFSMNEADLEYFVYDLGEQRDRLIKQGYTHAHIGYVIKVLADILGQPVEDLLAA